MTDTQPDLTDRCAGALYGLAVGDALGAVSEGLDSERIAAKYGRIDGFLSPDQTGSDDTEFTLFYAGLLQRYGLDLTAADVARHWLAEVYDPSESYPGAGFSEVLALRNLRRGLQPPESGRHLHSWSDGLAMSTAPYGCVYPGRPEQAARLAAVFGSVSHDGEGLYGGMAVAAAVAMAVGGAGWEAVATAALAVLPADCWVRRNIASGLAIGAAAPDVAAAVDPLYRQLVVEYYHWSDLAPEALGLAFGLLAAARADFKSAVLGAVNLGRDADTIAAICGAIAGALCGWAALPPEWVARIGPLPGRCIRSVAGRDLGSVVPGLVHLARTAGESDDAT